ncbi:MAG: hypothetical protein QG578_2216, partial [Thermodesulfobacteriota bacterium]|nr:hypothetical protein [Thermodesulfobacteriota bacterium]
CALPIYIFSSSRSPNFMVAIVEDVPDISPESVVAERTSLRETD